jgi:hypothetical protein
MLMMCHHLGTDWCPLEALAFVHRPRPHVLPPYDCHSIASYEGHRLQQLGLQEAATGLMLDACRATSLCNADGCNGIDDLTYGGQGEDDIQNFRALYLRPQWAQESNPKFAAMCDNWDLAKAYKPNLESQAQGVYNQLSAACAYKVSSDWSPSVPYARVCIPTHVGMKRGIPADSYIMRVNPYGSPDTDYTSKTFYKGATSLRRGCDIACRPLP